MRKIIFAALLVTAWAPAQAGVIPFSRTFIVRDVATNGTSLHVRIGGSGPPVVLLHGFGDTGDMWAPLAAKLARNHQVIVPDLRGMGLSAHPETGYTKKNEAVDIRGLLDKLKITGPVLLVTHDIGNMVGYAFAAQNRGRIVKWVVMDAPLPGIGHWDDQLKNPKTWHFNFYGPDEERLVAGRERIYLDRFYDELSADPRHIDEQTRAHYAALYARPHAMHDAFNQFEAFSQDGRDNAAFQAAGKLNFPVLAIGGEKSYGTHLADELRFVASDVSSASVPGAGHWLMEEQPATTMALITSFIDGPKQ